MRVLFFNRFFHPDTSATSQIVSDLAFHLAQAGYEVHAVTSRSAPDLPEDEIVRGVAIHRVAKASTGPHSLFERAVAYLAYYRGARKAVQRWVRSGDIVVVKTDPPMLSAAVGPGAKRRGAKLVVWLQDIFPETAREYGIPGMGRTLGSIIYSARDKSPALCRRRRRDRRAHGGARVFSGAIARAAGGDPQLGRRRGDPTVHTRRMRYARAGASKRTSVVGYSGNLGRVHEFDTMLDAAAAAVRDDDRVRFLIVGRGPRLAEVQARSARRLANMIFKPHQDRDALAKACVPRTSTSRCSNRASRHWCIPASSTESWPREDRRSSWAMREARLPPSWTGRVPG